MDFTKFVRKPFVVEAVEITAENIEDVAKEVGTVRKMQDGTPYISVDRRLSLNVEKVYIGFWLTKIGSNIRCYSKKIFNNQFVQMCPEIEKWVNDLDSALSNKTE